MPSNYCPNGNPVHGYVREETAVYRECERVTKTLWIDGKRIGTIREVDEPAK